MRKGNLFFPDSYYDLAPALVQILEKVNMHKVWMTSSINYQFLKESNETEYWLELLYETDYIDEQLFQSLISDNKQITATLIKIIKTTKSRKHEMKGTN